MCRFRKLLGSLLFLMVIGGVANVCFAHPGPVDKNGCHLDGSGRKHCH
jgi:hypothetical protein